MEISETVETRLGFGLKGKRAGATGRRKWFVEEWDYWSIFLKTGALNRVRRVIDRENGKYLEHIEDERGNVIRHCEEPLSEHQGHGSAKLR